MHRVLVWTLTLLALGTLASAPSARETTPPAGKRLVERLITIADAGAVADPARVGKLLGTGFTVQVSTQEPFAMTCAPGYSKHDSRIVHYTVAPTPPSADALPGLASLLYLVTEHHDCSGYVQSGNDIDAELQIAPRAAGLCLTGNELMEWFKGITQGYATDGGLVYYYRSDRSARNGVMLSFLASVDNPCVGIVLYQRAGDTLRHRVAKQSQYACMLPHEAAFCRAHAPFDWAAGDVQDEMANYAVQRCGALDRFIALTPKTVRPSDLDEPDPSAMSEAALDPHASTPCSRVEAAIRHRRRP